MKPVSVVEIYTTKFSHSLFLLKIKENLMSIEKCIAMNPEKIIDSGTLTQSFYT